MRSAEAEARWPIMMSIPSIMNGACIMTRYRLNETMEATGRWSWMTIQPPTSRTKTRPTCERFCTQRGEAGAQVGVLDVAPLDPVGRLGQLAQLLLLGGEAADDADAVDVLVHHGGHLGQAGLDDPRHREERLPHLDADEVDEGHGHHGDEGQRHADGEHEAEGDQRDGALHEDHRRKGQVHLHRADVRVGPRDQLPRLHPVVEGERHAGEVLVEDVAQVELDGVGDLEEVGARDVAEDPREQRQHGDQLDVVVQRLRS